MSYQSYLIDPSLVTVIKGYMVLCILLDGYKWNIFAGFKRKTFFFMSFSTDDYDSLHQSLLYSEFLSLNCYSVKYLGFY